jgi:hypothetical protein
MVILVKRRFHQLSAVLLLLAAVLSLLPGCGPEEVPDRTREVNAAIARAEMAMAQRNYVLALQILREAAQMKGITKGQELRLDRMAQTVIFYSVQQMNMDNTATPPIPPMPE